MDDLRDVVRRRHEPVRYGPGGDGRGLWDAAATLSTTIEGERVH